MERQLLGSLSDSLASFRSSPSGSPASRGPSEGSGPAASELGVAVSELLAKGPLFAAHWRLVQKWGARINLTSVDSDEEAAWLHYRDSLEVLRWWPGGSLLDIGSGAGFPGVPLAIARPEAPVTLLEPRRKRASFLEVVRAELGLRNLSVICGRIEDAPPTLFETAVSRATFSDEAGLRRCLKWVAPGGSFIGMRAGEPIRRDNEVHRYEIRGAVRLLERWRQGDPGDIG